MRDPHRINEMLALLQQAWEKAPDLRLCQLLVNIAEVREPCPDLFYLEDDILRCRLTRALESMAQGGSHELSD